MRGLVALVLLLLAGPACLSQVQKLSSACVLHPELCAACSDDTECAIVTNTCQKSAYCVHRDAEFAVTQEGCAAHAEYKAPPADACRCVQSVCRAAQ